MKYKDFKMLSINDMKKITGGVDEGTKCGTCYPNANTTLTCYVTLGQCLVPSQCNLAAGCKDA